MPSGTTIKITQDQINEGPNQDAFRGPVNSAIREALGLHEGDMVLVRVGAITVQRRGRHPQHCVTPNDLADFLNLYDSERGKTLVQPSEFEIATR